MRRAQPPAVATWLLERLTWSPTMEALAGDLAEQHARGRSRGWYWRQAIGAIALDLVRLVTGPPPIAFRGVVVGWAVLATLIFLSWPTLFLTARNAGDALVERMFFEVGGSTAFRHMVLAQLFALPSRMLLCVIAAVAGWAVGRTHRRHQSAAVLLFALSLALVIAPLTLIALWNDFFVHDWRHDPARGLTMRAMRAAGLLQDTAAFLCLLTAGLWGARATARAGRRSTSAKSDAARVAD